MCKACRTPPLVSFNNWRTSFRGATSHARDIKRACREGRRDVPSWLAPKRSVAAELTYQLKRLSSNARHETETEYETV
jgi:hypothetical protein